jgi:hypothetical protein
MITRHGLGLGLGVVGEGGYRTTRACDRIALGLLTYGDAGRSTGATVRSRWQLSPEPGATVGCR